VCGCGQCFDEWSFFFEFVCPEDHLDTKVSTACCSGFCDCSSKEILELDEFRVCIDFTCACFFASQTGSSAEGAEVVFFGYRFIYAPDAPRTRCTSC